MERSKSLWIKTKEFKVAEQRKASAAALSGTSAAGDSTLLHDILEKTDLKTAIALIKKGRWLVKISFRWYGASVS